MNQIKILGVRIDVVDRTQAVAMVTSILDSESQLKIYTPNPEFLVKAQTDRHFRDVLNSGDLNICDGMGLYLASLCKLKRLTGIDLMVEMCRLANEKKEKVFLLGSANASVLGGAIKNLKQRFNDLEIFGDAGYVFDEDAGIAGQDNERLLQKICASGAKIIFVAFGMGKQEKWIAKNLARLPDIKIAMGVGGSFDYLSGAIPRAPMILRRVGLEWMYRLVKQPNRLFRIVNAVIIFGLAVIIENIKNKISKIIKRK